MDGLLYSYLPPLKPLLCRHGTRDTFTVSSGRRGRGVEESSILSSRLHAASETPPDSSFLDALWSSSLITRKRAAAVSLGWIIERHEQANDCPELIFATVRCQHGYTFGMKTI